MPGSARWRAKDGVWVLQAYAGIDPDTGKQRMRSRIFRAPHDRDGRQAALVAASEFYIEVKATGGDRRFADEVTLIEACEQWAAVTALRKDWSPKSVDEYQRVIDDRIKRDPIGHMMVADIRAKDLDAFYVRLQTCGRKDGAGGLAPASVRKAHTVIHAALQRQVKHDRIRTNPASVASPPSVPEPRHTPPGPDDIKRALQQAESDLPWYAYLRLEATTGARRGQMCGLRWTQIDWDKGDVRWDRAVVVHKKTERHPSGITEKGTKTNRVYRNALDPTTLAVLAALKDRAEAQCDVLGRQLPPGAFVFTTDVVGASPWRPDSVSRRWRKFADKLGMSGVRHHDLRHYLATYLLDAGEDPSAVAQRLGWSSAYTLMKVYAGRVPAADRRAATKAAELLE